MLERNTIGFVEPESMAFDFLHDERLTDEASESSKKDFQFPIAGFRWVLLAVSLLLFAICKLVKVLVACANRLKFKLWMSFKYLPHYLKRSVDIMASSILLLVLLPFFVLLAVVIKLESRGPILFKQRRIGKYGKSFWMWKFRSMHVDAEQQRLAMERQNEMQNGVIFKIKRDPRITRVGRFIRRASIDELPQLFNVLMGDMSLVGPRPPLPSEVDCYSPHDRGRLDVLPGITCFWQISGRSDIPFPKQVKMDIDYIEKQSFFLDMMILIKTLPAVITGKGAY